MIMIIIFQTIYTIKMDELDPRYLDFVEEQKDTLDYFYDDLFNHIVKNSLPTLTGKEKEYIFDKKENNCYKLKRQKHKIFKLP